MNNKLQEIKRKLNNEILENASNEYLEFDEYIEVDDIQWLIDTVEKQHDELRETEEHSEFLGDKIQRLQSHIQELEKENALLKAGSKSEEVNTFTHTGNFILSHNTKMGK